MKEELIQIDGKSYKKCKVVMLSINEKADHKSLLLCKDNSLRIPVTGAEARRLENAGFVKPQHLYILSDEKIKEGDWCIMLDSFENVFSIPQHYTNPKTQHLNKGLRKIIACTDDSLRIGELKEGGRIEHLPQPSQSFIEYFIEEYNKGNIITDVMVEHVDNGEEDWIGDDYTGEPFWNEKIEPKINSKDNTINIKPITSESEIVGEKIVEYCKQYEGTNKYNDVLKAIEFGYKLK